jgi:sporulation protein YlmC with PRC-barrel domain
MAKKRDVRKDKAGVGPDPARSRRRLVSIDDLDGYQVADGEPDIRGWNVCTVSGRELGSVEDLLVDPERGEVVMLEMTMEGDGVHAEVPLRSVQLDRGRKVVVVDSSEVESHDRHEVRARDRMSDAEREEVRGAYRGTPRDVRYGEREAHEDRADRFDRDSLEDRAHLTEETEETVVERRPVIEEVVVRRRVAGEDEDVR